MALAAPPEDALGLKPLGTKQRRSILSANRRLNLWEGSVRSTKTVTSTLAWLNYIVHSAPVGELYMIGKTERTLKRNVLRPMERMLRRGAMRYRSGAGEIDLLGRLVYTIGAADERAVDRIAGATSAGNYGDEVSLWPQSFWQMQLSRMSVPGAQGFYTTNPDNPKHWLKADVLDRAHEPNMDVAHFHFELDDNEYLSEEFKDALKAENGPPGSLWFRRYIKGLWVMAEGAIYDLWDPEVHTYNVDPHPSRIRRTWLGIDYGTQNPFHALLFHEVAGAEDFDDHIVISREWRWDARKERRQKTDLEYSRDLIRWLASNFHLFGGGQPILLPEDFEPAEAWKLMASALPERVWVDPSATSFIRQLWADGWPGVRAASAPLNDVKDGIRSVAALYGAGRLFTHEDFCVELNRETEGYVWDPKAAERGEDIPLKVDDHGPDAKRYGTMGMRRVWRPWVRAMAA